LPNSNRFPSDYQGVFKRFPIEKPLAFRQRLLWLDSFFFIVMSSLKAALTESGFFPCIQERKKTEPVDGEDVDTEKITV
jgi:hypothetical protein